MLSHVDRSSLTYAPLHDTTLFTAFRRHEAMQAVIDTMFIHSEDWLWDVNVIKSHILAMAAKSGAPIDKTSFHWGTEILPFAEQTKTLGVLITNDLSWKSQIAFAKQEGQLRLESVSRAFDQHTNTPWSQGQIDHQSKIFPAMSYAMEVWSPKSREEKRLLLSSTPSWIKH
jgi:hypothetical protein